MPSLFLYFKDIIYENKFELKNLFHFIVPIVVGATFIVTNFVDSENSDLLKKIFFFISVSFYFSYAIIGFVMLNKNIWRRNTDIKIIQKQNMLIKKWSVFLYVSFLSLLLIRITTSLLSSNTGTFNNHYLWISALVWMGLFITIFLTPEILYGYNFLNKTIEEGAKKMVLSSVWETAAAVIPISSEKDKKLEEKMKSLLMKYLHQIEELSFHTHAFRNPDLSLDDIAGALNIPISHIHFVFKYHCNESFTDFKKIVRIHDATMLLESGYLTEHKIESLSATVGFSSYNTFYLAFKNITGVTTQEYMKRF